MNPATVWRHFVDTAGEYDVEGPLDDVTSPITTYFAGVPATHLVFATKDAIVRYWHEHRLLPGGTAAFVLHGPATAQHCGFMRRIVDDRRVLFFGDLDPMDLTTFGSLRAGGTTWDHDPTAKINVHYRGINDHVLRLAEGNCVAARKWPCRYVQSPLPSLGPLLIRMEPVERRHLRVLCRLMPDLERVVGSRAFHLMRHGWKLEVEALHPHYFKRGFVTKLMRLVLDLEK